MYKYKYLSRFFLNNKSCHIWLSHHLYVGIGGIFHNVHVNECVFFSESKVNQLIVNKESTTNHCNIYNKLRDWTDIKCMCLPINSKLASLRSSVVVSVWQSLGWSVSHLLLVLLTLLCSKPFDWLTCHFNMQYDWLTCLAVCNMIGWLVVAICIVNG